VARTVQLDLNGNEADALRALRAVGDAADDAADDLDRLSQYTQDVNGRWHDAEGRFVSAARVMGELGDESERTGGGLRALGQAAAAMGGALAPAAGQLGLLVAGLGAAVPAAAALGAALAAVAPAAGVAVTGMLAMQLATNAVRIGMVGMEDAIGAAMDPEATEEFNAALEKLAPNAREFALQVKELSPAFRELQQSVQNALFEDLGAALKTTAEAVLPDLKRGLVDAAAAMNAMAFNVAGTARSLAKDGTLGTAIDSATTGLGNLSMVPAQVVRGLVQIAAAAGPTFERMTAGIATVVERISDGLARAFADGSMQAAIEQAADLLGQLAEVAGNVFEILGNVFGAANASGGGLIGTLREITQALADVTGGPEVQAGLQAIFTTMGTLAQTVAPLLGEALRQLGPVFVALAAPAQTLITALGEGLMSIITALGPVLLAAAQSVGALVVALSPLLPVIGELVAGLLPVFTPFFQTLTEVFTALAPVVQQFADNLTTALAPILAQLPALAEPLAQMMGQLALEILPVLGQLLVEISPSLMALGQAFSEILVALAPVLVDLTRLSGEILGGLMQAMPPIMEAVSQLATLFSEELAGAINDVVVPAFGLVADLLEGDLSGAFENFGDLMAGAFMSILKIWVTLPAELGKILVGLSIPLVKAADDALTDMAAAIADGIRKAVAEVAKLPGAAAAALGNLAGTLYQAGARLIGGFVSGIMSQIGQVRAALSNLTNLLPDWKGPLDKDRVLLYPAGVAVIGGFTRGLGAAMPAAEEALTKFTGRVSDEVMNAVTKTTEVMAEVGKAQWTAAVITIGKDVRKALLGEADDIVDAVKDIRKQIWDAFRAGNIDVAQRDSLVAFLGDANKELLRLAAERQEILDKIAEAKEYAIAVTKDALDFAALTGIKSADEDRAAPTGAEMVAGLQARLASIREFGGNLAKLARAGLSKSLLRQIIDAGLDGGAAIAAELANGPNSIINALNETQADIEEVADKLGLETADALFDAGGEAGKGFLTGLQAMAEEIFDAMQEMVEQLVQTLKDGFGKAAVEMATGVVGAGNAGKAAVEAYKGNFPAAAPAPPPKPQAPKPQAPAPARPGPGRPVNVNFGGITIKREADVGQVMKVAAFSARAAGF
jgi:phage-related protein